MGCAGQAPFNEPTNDAPPVAVGKRLTGTAMDYSTGMPLADTTITTEGIEPQVTATTIADGTFAIENVPVGSKVLLTTTRAGYRPTRNLANAITGDMTVDVYEVSDGDVINQYNLLAVAPTSGTAVVFADLADTAGAPLMGARLAQIRLLDNLGQPVNGIVGPTFFGASGDLDPALMASTVFDGRSRVAFLDVPPGDYRIEIRYLDVNQQTVTASTGISATADGAVLALIR